MKLQYTYPNVQGRFYKPCNPIPVQEPKLLFYNEKYAEDTGISLKLTQGSHYIAEIFSGNRLLPGTNPVVLAYAGHQFGHFIPQLGDGRAHLLGEYVTAQGNRVDIQLKGSGPTPYSRNGDGRYALGPALREYIMSEALYYLGVPSTRCLALISTGEPVFRGDRKDGAIITRIAGSHIRIGSFEYFAHRRELVRLARLADYTIARHYPEIHGEAPYLQLLDRFIDRTIATTCHWLRVGFIHGVMNTDNMLLCGETIDFGPCAMMGAYNPATSFSSVDVEGRYAFGKQMEVAQWNLGQFAISLLPILSQDEDEALEMIRPYVESIPERFDGAYWAMMADKFGLLQVNEQNKALMAQMLDTMQEAAADYTNTFLALEASLEEGAKGLHDLFGENYDLWASLVDEKRGRNRMKRVNPRVIPRNHLMETAIASAENGNLKPAEKLLKVLATPYRKAALPFMTPNPEFDSQFVTFCGT